MTRGQVCLESSTSFLPRASRRHCSVRKSSSLGRKTDQIWKSGNSSIVIPLFGVWIAGAGAVHGASFLFPLPPQRGPFHPLYNAAGTKATVVMSRRGTAGVTLSHVVLRLLRINELQRAANCIGLTKAKSAGYACMPKGRLRLGTSTATPKGSFPASSWRRWERSQILTPFQGRPVERFWRVQCGRFSDRIGLRVARNSCAQPLPAPALPCSVALICEFSLSVSGQELGAA